MGAVTFLGTLIAVYFLTEWLFELWGWGIVVLFWSMWLVWIVVSLKWGMQLERRAKNPLQGLLDMEGVTALEHESRGRFGPFSRLLPT